MKTRKKFKLRKSLPLAILMPLTSMVPLTSCGVFSTKGWDFQVSTNNFTEINYCLLIGQNDHSDSIERTRYTRKALGTLDESEETKTRTKDNPNIAQPINGKKHTFRYGTGAQSSIDLVVNEIEHMEQKSLSGATWDAITANATAETWIAKHGNKITFFVSNNDGMAEGAYWACNWIKGLPIFGYDANSTTIEKINAKRITGTVDQNASSQCGAMTMMMRNMLEDRDAYWAGKTEEAHGFGTKEYNPIFYTNGEGKRVYRGFWDPDKTEELKEIPYGYVNDSYITGNSEYIYEEGKTKARDVLIKSTFIDKDNVSGYVKEDGTAKEPKDMLDDIVKIDKTKKPSTGYNVCQTYASQSEAYLIATMRPYAVEYADRLNLDLTMIEGDGTDESVIINKLDALQLPMDGYLINMVKTSATSSYITPLAQKAFKREQELGHKTGSLPADGWDKFEDRLDTPVIFWNRQPHTSAGGIDKEIMNNKFFKYVYFVGVDNQVGGQAQGEGIVKHIGQWLEEYLNKR